MFRPDPHGVVQDYDAILLPQEYIEALNLHIKFWLSFRWDGGGMTIFSVQSSLAITRVAPCEGSPKSTPVGSRSLRISYTTSWVRVCGTLVSPASAYPRSPMV